MWKGVHMNYTLTIDDVIRIVQNSDNDHIEVIGRLKNELFIIENNITLPKAFDFIRTLTKSDLYAGPLNDDNPNREYPVWIFKKEGFGCLCYIKLKIINKETKVIVISLHKDEERDA
jgi:hypothetical protein